MRLATALFTLMGLLILYLPLNARTVGDSTLQHVQQLPAQYLNQVGSKAQSVDDALTKKTTQYLNKLSRIEAKLFKKLAASDTAAANKIPPPNYQQLASQMQASGTNAARTATTYVSSLDTLSTTLKFLQSQPGALGSLTNASGQLSQAGAQVQLLQAHLDETTLIQQYVSQRKQQLSQLLSQYTHLPPGVTQAFTNFKATGYYYRQQLEQYKADLNDPQKVERAAITILSKTPAYSQSLAKNSLLASLFQLPSGYGSGSSIQGLQTRDQIQQQLQQQVGGGGGQAVQQQLQGAQSQITGMQNSLSKYGPGGQDLDMPDFKPNQQKTKSFLRRLQYGFNVQFAKSTYDFPVTAALGLSVAYKVNDKSSIGVGASYNIGLGSGWNDMQFSNQGVGLRSFMDWKIKKTYYVTGGYELNYMTQFSEISQLQDRSQWQPSLLFGVEKKYKISSKLQGNLQILYDFLYKQEIPQGQMIKFRVGYNF